MKEVEFLGNSRNVIQGFPRNARKKVGTQLYLLQEGLEPADWKPMKSIGSGVREIRVSSDGNAFRVLYYTRIADIIYVLHAFVKKTQKTSKQDIDIARKRLFNLLKG